MRALAILLALGALTLAGPAAAQAFQVVAVCGTPNGTFSVGQVANATMNTVGQPCVTATGAIGGAVTLADGADVTQGAKADAKSTATDTTPITIMQVLKEISAMEQAPASRAVTNAGTFAAQAKIVDVAGTNQATVKAASTQSATTDTTVVVAQSPLPNTLCTSSIAVNQTSSTDLVTSVAKLHICSIVLISASAQSISLAEGTGTVCATGTAALIGGTSGSVALAANGGFSAVSDRAWLKSKVTADHLCLIQSGAGNVSGVITYADAS